MKSRKTINKKGLIIFGFIGIAFGLIFALIGGGVFEYKGESNWIEVSATITGFTSHGQAIIEYEANGVKYTKDTSYSSSSFKKGDKSFKVKYDPNNPNECAIIAPAIFTIPFIAVGATISGGSTIALVTCAITSILKKRKGKNVAISFKPTSMFEYKALDDSNKLLYRYKKDKSDLNSYIVEDKEGKVIYKAIYVSKNNYHLLNENIEIKRTVGNEDDLNLKINNKGLKQFFYERHVTFEVSEKENEIIYTMFNNLTKLAELHEIEHNNERLFIIISAKENIDDATIFALCVCKRRGYDF